MSTCRSFIQRQIIIDKEIEKFFDRLSFFQQKKRFIHNFKYSLHKNYYIFSAVLFEIDCFKII